MSTKFRSLVLTAVLGSAALLGGPVDGRAQATATPPEVLAALLVEVRGLRAAMEQMASAGPRVQLALGRLQLQEQRINTLVRRLEEIRATVAHARKEHDALVEQMVHSERVSREAAEPEVRRDAEEQAKATKRYWRVPISKSNDCRTTKRHSRRIFRPSRVAGPSSTSVWKRSNVRSAVAERGVRLRARATPHRIC